MIFGGYPKEIKKLVIYDDSVKSLFSVDLW